VPADRRDRQPNRGINVKLGDRVGLDDGREPVNDVFEAEAAGMFAMS
jgi:hypothetical protein